MSLFYALFASGPNSHAITFSQPYIPTEEPKADTPAPQTKEEQYYNMLPLLYDPLRGMSYREVMLYHGSAETSIESIDALIQQLDSQLKRQNELLIKSSTQTRRAYEDNIATLQAALTSACFEKSNK